MFKPRPSILRSVTRAVPRRGALNCTFRRLHSEAGNQAQHTARRSNIMRFGAATAGFAGIVTYEIFKTGENVLAEAPPLAPDEAKSKISVQHLQVMNSLEEPGVFAWGDNSCRVVLPNSKEKVIKTPQRLSFFANVVLRDLQLCKQAGVAVDDRGDVLQWGDGYAKGLKVPETTLKGKDIERVLLSQDKIVALSKDKTVYSFPISKNLQQNGVKPRESSWIPGMSSESDISYRILNPELGYLERVADIAVGRDHLLVLTSKGRVFSSAVSYAYPSKGQLGIPNLAAATRPRGKPYDTLHEVTSLKDHKITQVAAGDYHSVVLDKDGKIFTFGDNLNGQLGFEYNPEVNIVDKPTILSLSAVYPDKSFRPKAIKIAAGGTNSYFMVDVEDTTKDRMMADVLSCGTGIYGNLGNGRWTHIQGTPTKVKALSGLFEYDEATNMVNPIRLRDVRVGANHAAAIMANITNIDASSSAHDVNYGFDVLFFGNNEFYQLGTGKRNNSNVPVYIQPLAGVPEDLRNPEFTGSNTSGEGGPRMSGIVGGAGVVAGTDQVHRFQATPATKVKGGGRAEQTVVCGRGNTAVYMRRV